MHTHFISVRGGGPGEDASPPSLEKCSKISPTLAKFCPVGFVPGSPLDFFFPFAYDPLFSVQFKLTFLFISRFGFVTFATNEDVKRVLSHGVIFFRGKQINVGPAVKRQVSYSILCQLFKYL